jgi:nitric oxide reductase subunit B
MILYAGGSIALLFSASMLYTPQTTMPVTKFWRWWVVHKWVEGAFEFFVVSIIGISLVAMNLLTRRSAEKAVMFQALFVKGPASSVSATTTGGSACPSTVFLWGVSSPRWSSSR